MEFNITINNNIVKVSRGETILTALRRNGISIPTLCNWSELTPTGACRLCVVELEDSPELVTACSTLVSNGMKILTHSAKVIKARKTVLSLLLANHPEDCLYCEKNGRCELQDIAYSLNIRERSFIGKHEEQKTDRTDPSMILDMSKCILCGRCVRICSEIVGVSALEFISRGKDMKVETIFKKGLYYSPCIHCGKCIIACPTAAISEKSVINQVCEKLSNSETNFAITISESTIAWFTTVLGIKKFEDTRAFLISALRYTGIKTVNTSSFANEIFISEHARILADRMDKTTNPLIITDCPAIKTFIKDQLPELDKFVTKVPIPQQISGNLIKQNTNDNNILHISVVPCVSLKYDAATNQENSSGVTAADFVISSIELQRLLNIYGISIPNTKKDNVESISGTSAGAVFETKGGISESIIREFFFSNGNQKYPKKIFEVKSDKAFIEYEFDLNGKAYKIASIHGTDTLKAKKNDILRSDYLFVEVRSCNAGCVSGCGNVHNNDPDLAKKIKKVIIDFDEINHNDTAGKNPFIKGLYKSVENKRLY